MRRHLVLSLGIMLLGLSAPSFAAIQIWEEDQIEQEIKEALKEDRKDRDAIERMIELCESRGDFRDAANWVVMLTKTGLAPALIDGRLAELRNKIGDDQDIAIWETRLDSFRNKEEWGKALKETRKLIEKYSIKVGRLKNVKLDYIDKKEKAAPDSPDVLDPNVDGMLSGSKIRLQELIVLEAELKDKVKDGRK